MYNKSAKPLYGVGIMIPDPAYSASRQLGKSGYTFAYIDRDYRLSIYNNVIAGLIDINDVYDELIESYGLLEEEKNKLKIMKFLKENK